MVICLDGSSFDEHTLVCAHMFGPVVWVWVQSVDGNMNFNIKSTNPCFCFFQGIES